MAPREMDGRTQTERRFPCASETRHVRFFVRLGFGHLATSDTYEIHRFGSDTPTFGAAVLPLRATREPAMVDGPGLDLCFIAARTRSMVRRLLEPHQPTTGVRLAEGNRGIPP